MAETNHKEGWGNLPNEERKTQILRELRDLALQNADPDFFSQYFDASRAAKDSTTRMDLELQMFDRVQVLQQEGRMLSSDELLIKAETMISLGPKDMIRTFSEFADELNTLQQPEQPEDHS